MLRYILFKPTFITVLSWMDVKLCQVFFCICWDNHVIFDFYFVNVVYYIDLHMLNHPWELRTRTHPYTMNKNKLKINSKDLNIIHNTIKFLERDRQNILWHKLYKCFLKLASQGNRNQKKHKPVGLNQIYKLLHSKGNRKKFIIMKTQPMEWEEIIANDATFKDLIQNI